MSKQYDDPRFGIEKTLSLPSLSITSDVAATVLIATEDITVTEFGYYITSATTAPDDGASSIGIAIRESGGVTLASLRWGPVIRQTWVGGRTESITTPAAVAKNDTLTFVTIAGETATAGAVAAYVKYKERY